MAGHIGGIPKERKKEKEESMCMWDAQRHGEKKESRKYRKGNIMWYNVD